MCGVFAMSNPRRYNRLLLTHAILLVAIGFIFGSHAEGIAQNKEDVPELRLRASPRVSFAGTDILFVGEIRGGPDDNENLYCPSIEWDWGDETTSEQTLDCEPFESGTSEIRRRFSVRHTYDYGGRYEVRLNLKRRGADFGDNDILISGRTRIEVRGVSTRIR